MSNAEASRQAAELVAKMRTLEGKAFVQLQTVLGAAAVKTAEMGVRTGRDPYGRPWEPLTSRTGQPLRRTGNNIQRSWNARPTSPSTFVFGSRFRWLKTHQYGAVIKPKRFPRLRFVTETSFTAFGRGGKRLKRGRANMGVVFAKQVTIPRRQLVPEDDTGGIGEIWLGAFEGATERFFRRHLSGTGGRVG